MSQPDAPLSAAPWPRFGAFSYDYPGDDPAGMVAAFQAHGLAAVQLGGAILDAALASPEHAADLREQLAAGGVAVAGIAGYRNLTAPDPARRRAGIDFIRRCLEAAPLLGTQAVATETGTLHPESDWLPDPANAGEGGWGALYAALDELLPVAEAHGAVLALEGYVNNILQTHEQLAGLLERYPTPALQVVCDPYNYTSLALLPAAEALTAAFFERFAGRFVLAHLKDVGPRGAEDDTPEFGTGVFPQAAYLRLLRERRPDLPLILEHLPWDHIPAAAARVRDLL